MHVRRVVPFVSAALVALAFFAPGLSNANGRFPLADQLVVDPKDPSHIVLRTTYGILDSSSAGDSWGWICETVIGYGGTQDPAIGVLADGSILAGVFEGLSVTHDRGCSWAFVGSPLQGEYVIDVSVHRDEPSRAVGITSTGMGMGFHVILAETDDNGATWTQAGTAITSDMIALTVDVAPTNPDRVYVSGVAGKTYAPAIERSDDRGKTWTRSFFDAAHAAQVPYLAAIDPTNPDRVYVRLSGTTSDHLVVSNDGAKTFTEVFTTASDLLGFALSPDGSRVVIGSPTDGIFSASASDLAFQKTSSVQSRCLTWTSAGVYTCANEFVDGFTVGLSTDEGKTFTGIYKLAEICPVTCAADAATTGVCAAAWPPLAVTLGVDQSACASPNVSSSSGSPSPGYRGVGGCTACEVATSSRQTAGPWLAACAVLVALWRRRTRRSD